MSPNPGEDLRPLARIASGGELSRVLLALRCLLDAGDGVRRTLVFDEVDSGIGGAVAGVVGRKLSQLAAHHQVVCVTHLPQIACFAGRHHRVTKAIRDGRTMASVERLDGDAQAEEIARLLGGEPVTATALRHAREMIEAADVK
jgi:DNA repair protein RecN (Recombination protein N)